jgi:RNA recognition motif. (a.k.a. RRM, RBD, or RNP domain)
MSDKASLQPQAAAMYAGYSSSRVPYTSASNPYMNGQGKYNAGYGPSQLADAIAGLNVSGPYPFGAAHGVKTGMSGSQGNLDLNSIPRTGYGNNALMVLPNGQTVPLSALYGQQQNSTSDQPTQLQYVPSGMFPSFISGSNLLPGAVSNYNWPYGVPGQLPDLDPNHRGSWSSNEENGPLTPAVGATSYQESYPHYTYPQVSASAINQQYIAGPIQPMKCADNKSYEMVNLDELTQRDPPIPRAVPALWTNQDELSLAKCLQNPEGITNIYIRGFMPDTTDEDLERWASRFGEIESCKAIIEQDTGKCKGYVRPLDGSASSSLTLLILALALSCTTLQLVLRTAFVVSSIWGSRLAMRR